ncbi:MAG: hypothetical protein H5U01_18125 [Clostridia bacterium]|nr:hypothetical protein [Clostridia bacterium]
MSELNIYVNNVPAQRSTTCLISPVRVMPIVSIKLTRPTLELNGRRITFPVTLASGDYLEFDGSGAVRVYDARGALTETTQIEGEIPELKNGVNTIHFSCHAETPPQVHHRARVTVITWGKPLQP